VSSGTTPKMIARESQARMIGYGAMLMEGLVAVVAMIAAASLPVGDYYAMNTSLAQAPKYHQSIVLIGGSLEHVQTYETLTQESLRGRTGGAVTLAVGMAHIFDGAAARLWTGGADALQAMWKYWYHFAVMFEALFILTTIDAGTRIGRFLLQEVAGRVHPALGRTNWLPGAMLSTLLIVLGWAYFINANSMEAIWPMFGIANQMLAAIALSIASGILIKARRPRYALVTLLPLAWLALVTTSAAWQKVMSPDPRIGLFAAAADLARQLATGALDASHAAVAPQLIFNQRLDGWLTVLFTAILWFVIVDSLRVCLRRWRGLPLRAGSEAPYRATRLAAAGVRA